MSLSVSVALRKGKGGQKSQRISPEMLKDEVSLKQLLKCDEGFRFLKPIRGTPVFWQSVQKDILACVRQLGIPTCFFFVFICRSALAESPDHYSETGRQNTDGRGFGVGRQV